MLLRCCSRPPTSPPSLRSGARALVATISSSNDGLTFAAHRGEGAALLAFDVKHSLHENLAGFAVRYRSPEGKEFTINNRLTFADPVTADTSPGRAPGDCHTHR